MRRRRVYALLQDVPRAVYDGSDRLGSVVQRGEFFFAYDRLGHEIGSYFSEADAANGVIAYARRVLS